MAVMREFSNAKAQGYQYECKSMPSDPDKSIVALLSFRKDSALSSDDNESMGDYDLDLMIIQSGSRPVLSNLHTDRAISSDAMRFTELKIDTGRYILTPKVRAFGVRVSHEGSSRVNPYNETRLSLFIEDGKQIRKVLDDLIVSKYGGELNNECDGNFSKIERIIKIGNNTKKGFADLIITSTEIDSKEMLQNNECKYVEMTPEISHYTLQFDGQRYLIPAVLK
jgi:hypothetical protein